MFFLLFVVY